MLGRSEITPEMEAGGEGALEVMSSQSWGEVGVGKKLAGWPAEGRSECLPGLM